MFNFGQKLSTYKKKADDFFSKNDLGQKVADAGALSVAAPMGPLMAGAGAQLMSKSRQNNTQEQAKPQQSTQNSSNAYQGSGMTNKFMSNPSNYGYGSKPQQSTQSQTLQQPQTQSGGYQDAYSKYLSNIQGVGDRMKSFQDSEAQRKAEWLRKSNDIMGGALRSQIDPLKQRFSDFKGNVQADLAEQKEVSDLEKQGIDTQYGEALRASAQANRENQSGLQKLFSGLNAVDSMGFAQQAGKQASNFTAGQQDIFQEKAGKLVEATNAYNSYARQASSLINDEETKLMASLAEIDANIAKGTLDYENAVQDAYSAAQQNIMGIEDNLANLEYQTELQKLQFQQDMALAQKEEDSQPSMGFLQTGVPQTRADYIYMDKNPDKYDKQGGEEDSGKVVGMVDKLLSGGTKGVSGAFRPGAIPGVGAVWGNAGQQQANWEGLKNLLTLARRGELKGSGAVSDFETRMLEKAALAGLDPAKMNDEAFRVGLEQLAQDLSQGQYQYQQQGMGNFES